MALSYRLLSSIICTFSPCSTEMVKGIDGLLWSAQHHRIQQNPASMHVCSLCHLVGNAQD